MDRGRVVNVEGTDRSVLSDRELLVRIDTRLDAVIEDKKDHEARIRKLEDRRTVSPGQLWSGLAGAVGAASAAIPVINWVVNK